MRVSRFTLNTRLFFLRHIHVRTHLRLTLAVLLYNYKCGLHWYGQGFWFSLAGAGILLTSQRHQGTQCIVLDRQ
jgi:hypothetical protein